MHPFTDNEESYQHLHKNAELISISGLRVRLVPLNMFNPCIDFFTDRTKAVLLL